jgi:hypothetical protein
MDENFEQVVDLYFQVFQGKPDIGKLHSLVKFFGISSIIATLEYFTIFPPKLKEGKNYNPYGLIWICTKNPELWML